MWPTSTGNRTLDGAEAVLVSAAILLMLDALDERLCDDEEGDEEVEPTADMQLGIAVFDSLTVPQRIATLHHIAKHLLTDELPDSEDTSAVDDATIAAIYSEVQDQLTIEIGLDLQEVNAPPHANNSERSEDIYHATYWRSLVLAAYQQLNPDEEEYEELGVPRSEYDASLTVWEDLIDSLASAILWDRDFELVDGFMDEEPSSARHRRKLLGIHENYFVQPPLDPTTNQTKLLLAQARSLASRRAR